MDDALLNVKNGSWEKHQITGRTSLAFFPLKMADFSFGIPNEEHFISYFKHLLEEKKKASSSLWTCNSILN